MVGNKMYEELTKITSSIKNIIELYNYEEVQKKDDLYPFKKSLDELLIDLLNYKKAFKK